MADERTLAEMMAEFQRVGVEPDTVSAGLAVRGDEVMRLLQTLPNGAGPEAFLRALREGLRTRADGDGDSSPPVATS